MTLAAHALTYDVSGNWDNETNPGHAGGPNNDGIVFTKLRYAYSASQVLLTAEDLVGILPKTNADGITRAKITSISVKMHSAMGYFEEGSFSINAYAQNIDATSFPVKNNKPQVIEYTKEHLASATVEATDEVATTIANGGTFVVTLNFGAEGFIYDGKSILLTVFSENKLEDIAGYAGGPLEWCDGIYYTPKTGETRSGGLTSEDTAIESLSGELSNPCNDIPNLLFTYEEEVEKLGPTVTEGPADVYTTVDYDSPDTGNEGSGQILPHDAANYQYSFCQTLYTSEDLKGLNGLTLSGEDIKAKITALTFKISGGEPGMGYYNGEFNTNVYIQNIAKDVTDFPEKDGMQYWFDNYTDGVVAHMSNTYEQEAVDLPAEFTLTVDESTPFIYEGGSILITWISNGTIEDLWGNGFYSQVFTGSGHSAVISSNNDNSSTTGAFTKYKTHHSSYLPVLKIDYVPLTYSGGEAKTVVSFTNVKYGVAKAANNKGVDANNVYVEFDLEDASDCGSYDIYLGTKQIGHMTGKHGFVNFLTVSDKDQTISVTPNGGENVIAGTPLTITASDLNALFEAPVVTETVETMLYGEYDITAKKVDLQGAAAVKVTTSAPISRVTFDGKQVMFKDMGGANGYQDAFEVLIPATATKPNAYNPALNNGVISFYDNNIDKTIKGIDVVRHEPQIENISKNLPLKPVAQYLFLKGATVTEDAIATASAAADTASVYRIGTNNYSVRFNAETPMEFVIQGEKGSEAIMMEEDDEYLTFYHNKAESLQYRLEPTQPEEPGINALAEDAADSSYDNSHEWTTAEKGYINLNLQENKGNKVFVRTVDTKGNARLTAYREIKHDGTTSGVADIEAADAAGAEYFNLQGIRVSGELTPGIYIRRQGTTATKVTVK